MTEEEFKNLETGDCVSFNDTPTQWYSVCKLTLIEEDSPYHKEGDVIADVVRIGDTARDGMFYRTLTQYHARKISKMTGFRL